MSAFFVKFFVLVLGFAAAASLFMVPYLNDLTEIERKSEVKINDQIIIAEVVSDAKERAQGFSGRNDIGVNEGMLFVFSDLARHAFWMKGMRFPIDIIWINGSEVVGVAENAAPQPGASDAELKIYFPPEDVNKVLEVKAGRARLLRAEPGDQVKIKPLVPGITN